MKLIFIKICLQINFVGNIKQLFYQLWKFKLHTLIIDHFVIKYILYSMVTRRSLRWYPWRTTTSLFFHVNLWFEWFDLNIFYCIYTYTKGLNTSSYNLRGSHLYTLIHFWQRTKMSNTNLNNPFQLNIKFDGLLREIEKRRVWINHVSIIRLKSLAFPLNRQRHVTT